MKWILAWSCLWASLAMATPPEETIYYLQSIDAANGKTYLYVKSQPFSSDWIAFELSPVWFENKEAGWARLKNIRYLAKTNIVPMTISFSQDGRSLVQEIQIRPDQTANRPGYRVKRVILNEKGEGVTWLDEKGSETEVNQTDWAANELYESLPKNNFEQTLYYPSRVTSDATGNRFLEIKLNPKATHTIPLLLSAQWLESGAKNLEPVLKLVDWAENQKIAVPLEIVTAVTENNGREITAIRVLPGELTAQKFSVTLSSKGQTVKPAPGTELNYAQAMALLEKELPSICKVAYSGEKKPGLLSKLRNLFW